MSAKASRKVTLSKLAWERYPVRTCHTLHYCEVCCKDITSGERYYDGGYSRRAHERCMSTEAPK